MPVNLPLIDPAQLHAVAGVRWGIAEVGVRKAHRKDLSVMLLDEGASVAGVFTSNRFCAAPVLVCQEHLSAQHGIRALVINTGNANAGTGAPGLAAAERTCAKLAELTGVDANQILPYSTGVIGERLPMKALTAGVDAAAAQVVFLNGSPTDGNAAMFKDGKRCEKRHLKCKAFTFMKEKHHHCVDAVVGVGAGILQSHLDLGYFPHVPSHHRRVIWNSVVVEGLGQDYVKPSMAGKPLTFGYLGRINIEKGVGVIRLAPSSTN